MAKTASIHTVTLCFVNSAITASIKRPNIKEYVEKSDMFLFFFVVSIVFHLLIDLFDLLAILENLYDVYCFVDNSFI